MTCAPKSVNGNHTAIDARSSQQRNLAKFKKKNKTMTMSEILDNSDDRKTGEKQKACLVAILVRIEFL